MADYSISFVTGGHKKRNPFYSDNMTVYKENQINYTEKVLELERIQQDFWV